MKYFRVHTKDIVEHTQHPRGLFAAIGRLENQKILTDQESKEHKRNKQWFEANLPVPPFYNSGNQEKAITWYKNNELGNRMFKRMIFYFSMADKYKLPLFLTKTDDPPGEIIYEDDFQIAVTNSRHNGHEFLIERLIDIE